MSDTQFDSIIHAPIRLQLCALLSPLEDAEFQFIRDQLDVSDSVLSKHVKQLEEAGYVKQSKKNFNGRQRTWLYLSDAGRKAFKGHVAKLMQIVEASTS